MYAKSVRLRIRLAKAYEIGAVQGIVSTVITYQPRDIPVKKGILCDYLGDFEMSSVFFDFLKDF
jgi:hypothetical protein